MVDMAYRAQSSQTMIFGLLSRCLRVIEGVQKSFRNSSIFVISDLNWRFSHLFGKIMKKKIFWSRVSQSVSQAPKINITNLEKFG